MSIFRALMMTCALALAAPHAHAAHEKRPDADAVRTLVALGCSNIPEEGPRAMNCATDTGYFLCSVFEKLGKPFECSGSTTPAIRDVEKLSNDHFLHTELPRIAEKTPCAIWAYPEDDAIKHAASRRCALQVLRSLRCTTSPANDAAAIARPDTTFSATCESRQRTCASLLEAGLVDRCAP